MSLAHSFCKGYISFYFIYMALTTFFTHDWIGIFTDSLSSLQSIRHHHTNPGTTSAKHYHHHNLLLGSITDLLEIRRLAGIRTTLRRSGDTPISRATTSRMRPQSWRYHTMKHSRRHKHDELRSGKWPPVQLTRSCTRLNHCHHYWPCPLPPIARLSTAPGGPSRKRNAYECMRSRARPPNSD